MIGKIFLSHSSAQKKLIEEVAKELNVLNIHFDEWTFESGYRTWDEILAALDDSGLFVLLGSKEAFESDWVIKELHKAKELLDTGKLKGFFAINIDSKLEITSQSKKLFPKFPEWIFDEYNLRQVLSPKVIASKIRSYYNNLNYRLDSDYKKYYDIYIGRDEEKALAKNRIADRITNPLSCIIVSGFESIGRNKFLRKVLEESAIIKTHQEVPTIFINENESIENFIVKIYSTQSTGIREEDILDLGSKSMESKLNLAAKGLLHMGNIYRVLVIEDYSSLVDFDGKLADWFETLLKKLEKERGNKPLLGLITKTRVSGKYLASNPSLYQAALKPLSKKECKTLFNILCEYEKISIDNPAHTEAIVDLLTGTPDQIFYAVKLILSENLASLLMNLDLLKNYNYKRVISVLEKFRGVRESQAKGLLKMLSQLNIFNIELVENVVSPIYDRKNTFEIISAFTNNHILELLKPDSFLYQVNRTIRLFIATNKDWKDDPKLSFALEQYLLSKTSEVNKLMEDDFQLFELVIKEGLFKGNVDNRFILPSYQLTLLIQKYREERYDEALHVGDELIDKSQNLDRLFLDRTYNWYCKTLIRLNRGDDFKKIVTLISDKVSRLNLFGFFHRTNQRYKSAIEKLKEAEKITPKGRITVRELALCYMETEDYKNAHLYAKKFHESASSNIFSTSLYFRAVVRHKELDEHYESTLNSLINEMEQIEGDQGENYLIAKAQYFAFIKNNKEKAYDVIDEAIEKYTEKFGQNNKLNGYPLLDKMSFAALFGDIDELNSTIQKFKSKFGNQSKWISRPQYLKNLMRYYELSSDKLNFEKYKQLYDEKSRIY